MTDDLRALAERVSEYAGEWTCGMSRQQGMGPYVNVWWSGNPNDDVRKVARSCLTLLTSLERAEQERDEWRRREEKVDAVLRGLTDALRQVFVAFCALEGREEKS